jgi:acetyl esterase/lipase
MAGIARADGTWPDDRALSAGAKKWHAAVNRDAMPADTTSRMDQPYLNDDDPLHRLDIYFPARQRKPSAILVHLHGGGWRNGDKNRMKTAGMFFASQGIIFIAPNYRLSPAVRHPAHIEDCAAAVAWVFGHAGDIGGNRNNIYLSGHSAGAHLAALLGTNGAYLRKYGIDPQALAGVIPVDTASFNLLSPDNERFVKRLVRKAFGSDPDLLTEASPFYNISSDVRYPRFLVLNTTNRASAAAEGRRFVDKLNRAGCEVRFIPVNGHTHREMATGMHDASDPVGKSILTFILPTR